MTKPLVSISMPVYNTAAYLVAAIKSLQDQTLTDWELIAVNDGSTDQSLATLQSINEPRLRIINKSTNDGAGTCHNLALEQAQGQFIALMDSDDIVHSDRLELSVRYLQQNPAVLMVGSLNMPCFQDGQPVDAAVKQARSIPSFSLATHRKKAAKMVLGTVYLQPTVMFRRSLWGDLRYSQIRISEDYEMWTRAIEQGLLGDIPFALGFYRTHAKQTIQRTPIATKVAVTKQYVWQPLLSRWGIPPNPTELDLHAILALTYRPLRRAELPALTAWVGRLEAGLQDHRHVDAAELGRLITIQLYEAMRESVSLGPVVFQTFERRLRQTNGRFSVGRRLRLLAKSLLYGLKRHCDI